LHKSPGHEKRIIALQALKGFPIV